MPRFDPLHRFDPMTPRQTMLVGGALAVGCGLLFAILAAVHFSPGDRVWGRLVLIGLLGILLVILGIVQWIRDDRRIRREARAELRAQSSDPPR